MTLFDTRERSFEQMFAHDEEARFRALARRNRLLGQWAASQLGLSGRTAEAYIDEIGRSLVAHVVDTGLVEKLLADFEANGVARSEEQIREKMSELMATAVTEVRSSTW
jgi:hypothetical protein